VQRDIDLTPIKQFGLNLDQYFGLWAVEGERFISLFDRVGQMNLTAHVSESLENEATDIEARSMYPTQNADKQVIALIDIEGTLTKRGSSFSSAGSLVSLRRSVQLAARDPEVDAILLRIDSPGGTVSGTQDLADEVRRAGDKKPVWAFCEDLTASAAYWVASQCEKVFANASTAVIGSIGTFVGLYDYSQYAEKEGIRAVVVKAGELKGSGFPGTEITDEQVAYWQGIVDETQAQFTAGVAAGRGRSTEEVTKQWVTGRVYVAEEALSMGLIDGIQSFEQTLQDLSARAKSSNNKRTSRMSDEKLEMAVEKIGPTAATIGELKAACPGADSDFLMSQLESSATVATAQSAWIAELNNRNEAAEKKAAAAEEKAEKKRSGAPTVGTGQETAAEATADPIEAFTEAVKIKVEEGLQKQEAISAVVRENPDLHQAYLAEYNLRNRSS